MYGGSQKRIKIYSYLIEEIHWRVFLDSLTPLFDEGVYCVVDNNKLDMSGIQILKGEWKDVIYVYGKVGFEEGKPNINFQRDIVVVPENHDLDELLNNKELNNLMGDILVELLQEQMRKENEQGITEGTD
jgi:hypothetical protein